MELSKRRRIIKEDTKTVAQNSITEDDVRDYVKQLREYGIKGELIMKWWDGKEMKFKEIKDEKL